MPSRVNQTSNSYSKPLPVTSPETRIGGRNQVKWRAQWSTAGSRAAGIESAGYVWNEMEGEKLLALQAKGDVSRGAVAFEVCQGCHRNGGTGRVDGSYPRLAGQHSQMLTTWFTRQPRPEPSTT